LINAAALVSFEDAISQAFGNVAGIWYILLQCSQFHVMYYASRTLPNMYAFALSTFNLNFPNTLPFNLLQSHRLHYTNNTATGTLSLRYLTLSAFGPRPKRARRQRIALSLLTTAGIIFRSELALLLATTSLYLILTSRLDRPTITSLIRNTLLPAGITSALFALLTTITIDSFFWHSPLLWPEWSAFRFNTLQGKSADWGTSPWYFYFINSLPKLLMNPLSWALCIPLAFMDRGLRRPSLNLVLPSLGFVVLYSALPHKEWRFVLYVVPALTGVAAAGAAHIWTRRNRSWLFAFLSLALVASTAVSFVGSMVLLFISSLNYPGAVALGRLHELAHGERPMLRVHLDNLSCQTGVTRFLQKGTPVEAEGGNGTVWFYDKTDVSVSGAGNGEDGAVIGDKSFWERFDYVLVEAGKEASVLGNWRVVDVVEGYTGVGMVGRDVPEKERERKAKEFWKGEGRGLRTVVEGLEVVEGLVRRYVTGGRWVEVKMEPKIKIMRKVD